MTKEHLMINSRISRFFLFSLFLLSFHSLSAAPQEFSCWKKSKTSPGRIIIMHDNHLLYYKKNEEQFIALSRKLQEYKQLSPHIPLNVYVENTFEAEHGDVMRLMSADAKTDRLFLFLTSALFKQSFKTGDRLITYRCLECRNLIHLISSWLTCNQKLARANSPEAYQKALMLIDKSYKVVEKTTLKDIYLPTITACKNYLTHADNKHTPLFLEIKNKLETSIESMKKEFKTIGLSEDFPITQIFCDPGHLDKVKKLATLLHSTSWIIFLTEAIQMHALFELMQLPENHSALFIIGFKHAQDLENLLLAGGYTCESRKKSLTEQESLSSFDCILPPAQTTSTTMPPAQTSAPDHQCAFCLKKSDTLLRCSLCKQVYYCNQSCQNSDWTKHKQVCKKK